MMHNTAISNPRIHGRGAAYFNRMSVQRQDVRMLTNGTSGLPGALLPTVARHMHALQPHPDLQTGYYVALSMIQGVDPKGAEAFVHAIDQQIAYFQFLEQEAGISVSLEDGMRKQIRSLVGEATAKATRQTKVAPVMVRYA
ncbi:MAG: hypothetical protein FJX76_17150 [Armatimonadetes bacterium]|nr:hypothetical protein [Armatimonadota bacterium]